MIHQEPILPSGALEVRPTLATLSATPAFDRDFELLLLDGDRLLSAARGALPQSAADAAAIRGYLSHPTADFAALCLTERDRVLLLSPCFRFGNTLFLCQLFHITHNQFSNKSLLVRRKLL